MTNGQVKDFFEAVLADGPADLLDVDRAVVEGRRRRRMRTVATVGSAAAVVMVAGALVFTALPRTATAPASGGGANPVPGPSTTTQPAAAVTGTTADWLAALERSMPYVDRTTPVSVTTNGPVELSKSSSVTAVFRYLSDGRTTSLQVTAMTWPALPSAGTTTVETALAGCDQGAVTCDPVRQTVAGPVLIRHASARGFVDAVSFRASGIVVVARIPDGSTASGGAGPGAGPSGLAISLDDLVNIAALSPEPVLAPASDGPIPTASAALPAVSPVITVAAGQKVDLGAGSYLTVTPAEKCMVIADPPNPPNPNCKSLTDGNQASTSISMQSATGNAGTPDVITGIYTGTDATAIVVTVGGKSKTATIVKLGAHPTSLVYFVIWPTSVPAGTGASGRFTAEAFDATGHSLATL